MNFLWGKHIHYHVRLDWCENVKNNQAFGPNAPIPELKEFVQ